VIGGAAIFGVAVLVVMMAAKLRRTKRESGKGTDSGVSSADHVPDLSPSEVVPPTTGGTIIVYGYAVTVEMQ